MTSPDRLDDNQQAVIITLCRNLLMHYATAIDTHDFAAFASLFTQDGVFERPNAEPLVGRGAIKTFLDTLFAQRRAGNPAGHLQRHLFTTVWIEPLSLTEARGVSCALAYRDVDFTGTLPSPTRLPELLVEYRDHFRRDEDGWRLHRHVARHLFSERAGSHLPVSSA